VSGPSHAPGGGAQRYALLSIAAALATISLKTVAWKVTGSVGLLSDAVESVVNLLAAVVALWALRFAAAPPDAEHQFGHAKAEYLASAFEGLAILGASVAIALTAWERIADPRPIEQAWLGIGVSTVAAGINGGVAFVLFRAGRRLDSIALRSDAHHLMTDVWTSAGVLAGVALVELTGWHLLDPIVALGVASIFLPAGHDHRRRHVARDVHHGGAHVGDQVHGDEDADPLGWEPDRREERREEEEGTPRHAGGGERLPVVEQQRARACLACPPRFRPRGSGAKPAQTVGLPRR
jgi:hypothetical protein